MGNQDYVPRVIITNTLHFTTVLILLFFLSVIAYDLGLLEIVARVFGMTGTALLGYILAAVLVLIVLGSIIVENSRVKKYLEEKVWIRKIEVKRER